jgi:hypothetical protein
MLRSRSLVPTALTVFALGSLPLAGAEERVVPERLVHATYISLGYDLGDRIVPAEALIGDPWRVLPHEREALDEIRSRLKGWGRYVVEERASNADLMLVVRSGRRASLGAGIGTGGGRPGVGAPGGSGVGVQPQLGGAFSSPDDMLAVYDITGGRLSTQLWRGLVAKGLSGEIPLFEAFREDVERAAARRAQP